MQITEVRVFPVDEEKLKAYASIVLDACFIVNDLKVIECHELLRAIAGQPARVIDFDAGLRIERTIDSMARSDAERRWLPVEAS